MNSIFHYGHATRAVLNASERKGPVKIVFPKIYDITILISEKF